RVEGLAARHRIHRRRSPRAAWHSRTKVTTPCMSASFTPCLTSAVARAPETPVVMRLLPPMQTGGCLALRTDSLRGRHTDQHRLLFQYHRLHGSLRRQGTPKSSLPTNYLGAQFICDLVAGAAGPERTAFSTDSSARSGNPRRN